MFLQGNKLHIFLITIMINSLVGCAPKVLRDVVSEPAGLCPTDVSLSTIVHPFDTATNWNEWIEFQDCKGILYSPE